MLMSIKHFTQKICIALDLVQVSQPPEFLETLPDVKHRCLFSYLTLIMLIFCKFQLTFYIIDVSFIIAMILCFDDQLVANLLILLWLPVSWPT